MALRVKTVGGDMRDDVWFGLLGPLHAAYAGVRQPVPAAKLRAILAALLLRAPRDVSIEELVDAVWPDAPPRDPRSALHTYLNRLRRTLGPMLAARLVTGTAGYRAEVDVHELDVSAFEEHRTIGLTALRTADPGTASTALRAAIDLWRGDPLSDVPACRLRDEHATRLAELLAQTWESFVEAELALGRAKASAGELRRLVRVYPLRERFTEQLMLALYQCDQQGDALTAYQELQVVLRQELGVRPGPALRQLYERILAQDPTLRRPESARQPGSAHRPAGSPGGAEPATRPAQLPAAVADFTGRDDAITALRTVIADSGPGPTVAIISGIPGVGKTTLAVQVAHLVRDQYQDGQLFIELRGTSASPPRPADLLARILRDLGVEAARIPIDLDERTALYRSMLAERRVLLVLDDAHDAAQVRPLIPGGHSCAVLITSRTALATLPTRLRRDLDPFTASEAVGLLGRITGDRRVTEEPAAAADVVAACGRLPLAIRIAAARMLTRPAERVQAFAEVLADATARLDLLTADDLGVRASFSVSYERLGRSPASARAFRLSGLWTGCDITVDLVAALLDTTRPAAQDALAELVDAHLLTRVVPTRFRAHDLMRAYAAERAMIEETPDDRVAAVRRMLVWYLGRAQDAAAALNPVRALNRAAPAQPFDTAEIALAWLDDEAANLVAATHLASEYGMHDLAGALPLAMFDWFLRRLDYGSWIDTHEVGLAGARAIGDDWLESRLLNNLSGAYLRSWRPADALAVLDKALVLHRRRADRYAEAVTLANLVNAYFQLGRMDEAHAAALETIDRYREVGRPDTCGQPLITLGEIHRGRGDFEGALRYTTEALAVARSAGDRTTEGHALANFGHIFLALGRLAEAVTQYRSAIAVADADGDRYTVVEAQEGLGDALDALGDPAARTYWTQAWETYRDIGDERAARLVERLARG